MPSTTKTTTRETACPLDCPDSCSLEVTVEDGRVTKLGGTTTNPVTAGFICSKVRHYDAHLYHELRVQTPLIRLSGAPKGEAGFRPASWDEALALVATKLREAKGRSGGASILPFNYGGSNGKLTDGAVDNALFARLNASRLLYTVCAAPTGAAAQGLYGKMLGAAFDDFVHAQCIVVWGANPHASNIHLAPFIKKAQGRGTKLLVVDPRRIKVAKAADLHLAPRPGTDLALALSIVRFFFAEGRADRAFLAEHATGAEELERRAAAWTFERAAEVSCVPAADIEAFARTYADADPALVRCGWGLERNRNGGSAAAAVLALPAVAGKFGKRGGGYCMSNQAAFSYRQAFPAGVEGAERRRPVDMNQLGRTLLDRGDPPVDVLFVYDANPLMTIPDQERVRRGLAREDLFTVVHDAVLTDTARYADVVLPATTFLEHHEVRGGYGAYALFATEPVIAPVGEARPNYEVFAELIERLGLARDGDDATPAGMTERVLEGETLEAVRAHGMALPPGGDHPVQFVDEHPRTPDGKIHLVPPALDAEAPDGLYAYREEPGDAAHPLALVSAATERTISSTLGQLHTTLQPLGLHPDDAAARGLADGAAIRVFNDLGEVHTVARLDEDLRPGVVSLPKGIWSHNTENGNTANALCPDTAADLGRGACFNDARVQVEAR
jgi:anaerobic selenocysteine-containing dehydrogenase